MTHYTPAQGAWLIAGYALVVCVPTWWFTRRYRGSKESFLLAGRSLGTWESALSIAATWIWAPALFIAAERAYTRGIAGVFWFTVPNVACLVLFGFFADRVRRMMPEGFTLSHFIRTRHSRRVQVLYWIELGGLAVCSFAVQLLAGGVLLSALTGLDFFWITVAMAGIAMAYTVVSGLKASVVTDYAQMLWILAVSLTLVPWAVSAGGGVATVRAGLGGISGRFGVLFGPAGREVAVSFGVPVTVGLLAGPFGDQAFWQRGFAVRAGRVKRAFFLAACLFAVVPILMSVLGFVAAGRGWHVADPAVVNLETILRLLPAWTLVPMVYMLMSGLISTLDSNLCAVACLAGHDWAGPDTPARASHSRRATRLAQAGMGVLAVAAIGIANLPGLRILHLFLFYGTLRASTFLPTVLTILSRRIREAGMFWGIVVSLVVGVPMFAYGKMAGRVDWVVAGSLTTVLSSAAIAVTVSLLSRPGGRNPPPK